MKKHTVTFAFAITMFLVFAFGTSITSTANLTMHPLFTNHMVLQQQHNVPIWGKAEPKAEVYIKGSWGEEATAVSDAEGNWKTTLTTPKAGGPFELEIGSGKQSVFLTDVMIGEVWLASGQSNMEMPLPGFLPKEPIDNYEEEIANADYSDIRMFTVKKTMSTKKMETLNGSWEVCNPENAGHFSAAGYFFARKLYQEIGVPIGIVHSSWGGTVAEAWTSEEGLSEFPHFLEAIAEYDLDAVASWASQFESVQQPKDLNDLEKLDRKEATYAAVDYDDSNWPTVTLPAPVCHTDNFIPNAAVSQSLHGSFWYRKQFELETVSSDYTLTIGAIDDADITYINGHQVGATWLWSKKRVYTVPSTILKKGTNTIAINQYDNSGGSVILGPLTLEENGTVTSLEGNWSGFFQGDLLDQDLIMYTPADLPNMKNRPLIASGGPNELPSSLYNAMIYPLVPYAIKGVIWYQGESNVGRSEEYLKLFPSMIADWRNAWGHDFPFYYVQIAPFEYGGKENDISQKLREAQRLSLATKNTGMAVTMDIGHPTSIHPGNKQDVGDRLARLALANDYDIDIVANGPRLKSQKSNGSSLELVFDTTGDKLLLKTSETSLFEIAGADKKFIPAKAIVKGNTLILSAEGLNEPKYARYGWKDYVQGTLFNTEGLPASSFTTEE